MSPDRPPNAVDLQQVNSIGIGGEGASKYSANQEGVHFRFVMPAFFKPASSAFCGFRLRDCRNDDSCGGHSMVLNCTESTTLNTPLAC
jgi:hypothetical protein